MTAGGQVVSMTEGMDSRELLIRLDERTKTTSDEVKGVRDDLRAITHATDAKLALRDQEIAKVYVTKTEFSPIAKMVWATAGVVGLGAVGVVGLALKIVFHV